jgi:hypothetical protein
MITRWLPSQINSALQFPIMTLEVLRLYLQLGHQEALPGTPGIRVHLPKRLFKHIGPISAGGTDQCTNDPIPFLQILYDHFGTRLGVDSFNGYALIRAVYALHIPLIRWLLDHGAVVNMGDTPTIKLAIKKRDLGILKMLVERVEKEESPNGKRRRLEDRVTLNSTHLQLAIQSDAKEIARWMMDVKGVVPNVQTIRSLG